MTLNELAVMAKTYEEAILYQKLTRMEVVCLMAMINKRIDSKLFSQEKPVMKEPPIQDTGSVPPQVHKAVPYDGVYDAPPPVEPEVLPPPVPSNKILARANQACICSACSAHVYTVNKDITEGCKIPDFIGSFTPMQGEKPVDKSFRIQNIDGNITTDCPRCKSSNTLYLCGRATL
jgi:hypothetical protein